MARLRTLLTARPWLAAMLVLAALAVRLVVPAGMMPAAGHLIVCPGHAATMPGMTMPGGHSGAVPPDGHDRTAPPCDYTVLLAAALDTAVAPLLPVPLALAVALAVLVLASTPRRARRLWPPRRGPPAAFA